MTEDILFDNIFIGHSIVDAERFGNETWVVKHEIEAAATEKMLELEEPEAPLFNEDPVGFVRAKVGVFLDDAREDVVNAVKTHPATAAGLGGVVFVLFSLLGVLAGLVGASQKPAAKVGDGTRYGWVGN